MGWILEEVARTPSVGGTADPHGYAELLTAQVAGRCGGRLRAAYLHGSAALGGWVAERSDVDVLFVAADDITRAAIAAAGAALLAAGADCPGRGLECSMVTAGQALRPAEPWPFLLHLGAGDGGQILHMGDEAAGDADLLMHYAVCRAAGITLAGPPPAAVIGPIGRPAILEYLVGELGWGLANAPGCYAVLNACRALVFLNDDKIVSKVAGGLAVLHRGIGPGDLVRNALDQQQARAPERPPGPEAVAFVGQVAAALTAAAGRTASPQA